LHGGKPIGQGNAGTQGIAGGHIAGIFFPEVDGHNLSVHPLPRGHAKMQDLLAGQVDMLIDTPTLSARRFVLAPSRLCRDVQNADWRRCPISDRR